MGSNLLLSCFSGLWAHRETFAVFWACSVQTTGVSQLCKGAEPQVLYLQGSTCFMCQDCCDICVTSRISSVLHTIDDPHSILTVHLTLASSRHLSCILASYPRHTHLLALCRVVCGYLMSPGEVVHQKVKKLLASHPALDRQFGVYCLSQAH